MSRNHRVHWFDVPYLVTGTINKIYPIPTDGPKKGLLQVGVLPIDNSFQALYATWMPGLGLTRQPRLGMQVGVLCIKGSPQFAMAFNHCFNDPTVPAYADPLPASLEYPDDMVIHHEETASFIRFRNVGSNATSTGPDNSPVDLLASFLSGATMEFSEYAPPGYPPPAPPVTIPPTPPTPPPPPTRAKLSISMPSTASVIIDEPVTGQATLSIEMPSGASVFIDEAGVVTVSAPETINLVAPEVNIGSDAGTEALAFKSDVDELKAALAVHFHTGVSTGGGVTGTPANPLPDAVGTQNAKAV